MLPKKYENMDNKELFNKVEEDYHTIFNEYCHEAFYKKSPRKWLRKPDLIRLVDGLRILSYFDSIESENIPELNLQRIEGLFKDITSFLSYFKKSN